MATLWVATSFTTRPSGGKLTIIFDHYVGDKVLQLDTVTYNNVLGQPFTVTKFKYYIGNVHLRKTNGTEVAFSDYYLIDEEEDQSKKINLVLPAGEYADIDFIIGVDSLHNCSGAQSGALDPVNAMFWTWNTGYIFLKLEGKSPASKSSGNVFEYHIGGYKQPANCIRHVSLTFAQPVSMENSGNRELHIKADAAEILKTPTAIDISVLSSVTDFHNATTIADNYMDMFSVLSVN
jgi:hypothetical protein